MQIDRHVERLGARQNRRVERIVEIAAAIVAVDVGALEAEFTHAARQFIGGGLRRAGRQRGEAGETLGVLAHGGGEQIVGVARKGDGVVAVQLLGAGIIQRQHLHRDAGFVHGGDAAIADIGELGESRGGAFAAGAQHALLEALAGSVEKSRRGEVFFEGDQSHGGPAVGWSFGRAAHPTDFVGPRYSGGRRPLRTNACRVGKGAPGSALCAVRAPRRAHRVRPPRTWWARFA